MSKFRKGLPTVENDSSDSEYEEYFHPPPNDEDRKKRKRQIKPPKKLSVYETEGSMENTEDELCWCIIEWEGENSYDCVNKKKVSALEGDLMFQPGEKIFANYRGKPFKATIAVIAATKSDAEAAYKENKQPKQSAKPPHKRIRQAESAAKPLEKEKQRKKAEKGKQETGKKRSQAQEERELKASIQKAQREQMKEVLKETNEMNYELISDDISDDDAVPVTPFHSSPKITTATKAATPRNSDQSCCQQCGANKDAIQRNSQALQILQQGISALKNEIEHLKKEESNQSIPSITSTPISSKKNSSSGTPRPGPAALQYSMNSSPESKPSSDASITDERPEKVSIPHHLKSKAAGANALKKAARILAIGLFTVEERCSCTVSGSSNKSKEDNKRPQFDVNRISLIHEFLQKTYPKTYQHGEVNRIIGQVAIESRQGRHATDDSIVVLMLQGAK